MSSSNYTEKDVTHFKRHTDMIRAKPGMYIGPTDEYGIFTILREVLDNAVDEARAGRNDLIRVWLHADGKFTVADNGVGIPVGKHKGAKISTLTHVLTNLQSSGKMKGKAYTSAIGTHGVGLKATNALSEKFKVWTYRKDSGGWHSTSFARGREQESVSKCKAPSLPARMSKKVTAEKGTVVVFEPDLDIFNVKRKEGRPWFARELLLTWAEMTSYMNAGLRILICEETPNTKNGGWRETEFHSKEGVKTYVKKRLKTLDANLFKKQQVEYHSTSLEMALAFTDAEGDNLEYFTNTVRNADRGVHADDFNKALFKALQPYMGKHDFTPTDVRDGMIGVVNYKIDAPAFNSQTKEKLVDQRVKGACYKEVLEHLSKFFKENKTLAQEWCKRAAELRTKTNAFLADKKLIKGVKNAAGGLASKLAGVLPTSKVPISERELYLVEGDSAGGTAKLARDKEYQATFATKGKPLNVAEAGKDKINENREVQALLAAVGLELGKKVPADHLQYGKIIYLADPDVDGRHIRCLFSAIFWKFCPDLFKRGIIHTVRSPEFMAQHKGKVLFGSSKESIYEQAGTKKIDVQHIKGWGEITSGPMKAIAFDPKRRKLIRITAPEGKKEAQEFNALMGKDATYRKQLLGVV